MAVARFQGLERRFKGDVKLKEDYMQFLDEYEALGHMEKIDSHEICATPNYFMPHHPVFKASSSTTKTRIVFDASAATTSGKSLNDIIRAGPTIQQDIWSIIIRFRTHQVCFTADIAKMYRQIKVHPLDRRFQRIVWRKSPDEPLQEYELTTITYGTASAPFLATRCLHQLAIEEGQNFPRATEVLDRDFYVDDCISGSQTVEEAMAVQKELVQLLSMGGFLLRKWCSNEPQFLEAIPHELRETQFPLQVEDKTHVTTLGLLWHTTDDKFQIVNEITASNSIHFTKRKVLAVCISI